MPEINLGLVANLLAKIRYNTGVARGSLTPQGTKAPDPVLSWFSRGNYKQATQAFNGVGGWTTSSLSPIGAGPAYPEVNFQRTDYTRSTNDLTEQEKAIVEALGGDITRVPESENTKYLTRYQAIMDTYLPGRYRDEPNGSRRRVIIPDILSFFPNFFTNLARLTSASAWDGGVVDPLNETYFFGSNYFIDTPDTPSEYNWRIGGQVFDGSELTNPAAYIDLLDYENNKKYFSLSSNLGTFSYGSECTLEVTLRRSAGENRSSWISNNAPWAPDFDGFTVAADVRWHEPQSLPGTVQYLEFEFLIEAEDNPLADIFQIFWSKRSDIFDVNNPNQYRPTCYMSFNSELFYASASQPLPGFPDIPTDFTSWGAGDGSIHRFSFCFNPSAKEFVMHRDGALVYRAEFTKDLPQIPSPKISATVQVRSVPNEAQNVDRTQKPEAGIGDCELSLVPLYSRSNYTVPDLQAPE